MGSLRSPILHEGVLGPHGVQALGVEGGGEGEEHRRKGGREKELAGHLLRGESSSGSKTIMPATAGRPVERSSRGSR